MRRALAARLMHAKVALRAAQIGLDGSEGSRLRYLAARLEHGAAEVSVLDVLTCTRDDVAHDRCRMWPNQARRGATLEENQDAVKVRRAVRDFSEEIQKHIDPAYELASEVRVETLCGPFPVPLCASRTGRSVAFDFLGGDTTPMQGDDFRDGLLLGSGQLQVIYRMRARDVLRHLDDILYGLSRWEPRLFTDRGREIVERKASARMNDLVREFGWPLPFGDSESIRSFLTYPEEGSHALFIERRRFQPDGQDDWSQCFRFAKNSGAGSLEEVMAAFARKHEHDDGIDL